MNKENNHRGTETQRYPKNSVFFSVRSLFLCVSVVGLLVPDVFAVQEPPAPAPPPEPAPAEGDLEPDKALEMLKEVQKLMEKAEELLNDSARGKALETEQGLKEKLEKLLGDASGVQGDITETIKRLLKESEGSEKGATEGLGEVIRRVRATAGRSRSPEDKPEPNKPKEKQSGPRPQTPSGPAPAPYDPNRAGDPVNRFRSRAERSGQWGNLPPRVREAILQGERQIDNYPAEYREALKEYMKRLAEGQE